MLAARAADRAWVGSVGGTPAHGTDSAHRVLPVLVIGAALLAPFAAFWANRTWGFAIPFHGRALWWPLLFAPVVEELIFRSLQDEVARWLRACRPAAWRLASSEFTAAAVVTAVFVAAHAGHALSTPWLLLAWVAPSAALALTWSWRRRWLDCIALHAWFNGCLWLASAV